MYGVYTPILLLQAFCVYHAYRNRLEQRWYWLILFFPLIGCIIYLVHNFNNRATFESLRENVKEVVISNYRIEQLEKALRFSDNLKNKIALADAYMEVARYQHAIELFSSCLQGFMSDDVPLQMKLLYAHFMNGNYAAAIDLGKNLEGERSFKNSEERVAFAWSFFQIGQVDVAEKIFEDLDVSFTNYYHRMEYCKFLIHREEWGLAKEKLACLLQEFEQMQAPERRLKKSIFREVKDLYTLQGS